MAIEARYAALLAHLGPTTTLRDAADSPSTDGVALRHDVDDDLDAALETARLEHRVGCRATYFLLHTASYWDGDPDLLDKARQLAAYGHEVGVHVNVLTEWVDGVIDDPSARLGEVLSRLRDAGLDVVGVSGHGDRRCYQRSFSNNWLLREHRGAAPEAREDGVSAEGIAVADPGYRLRYPADHELRRDDGAVFPLWSVDGASLGIEYSAMNVPFDAYFTDSGGAWRRSPDPTTQDLRRGRHQVLAHPEHWRAEAHHLVLVLSVARSGSTWLANVLDRATPLRARHEFALNHRYDGGALVAEHRTGLGFRQLARDRAAVRSLLLDARRSMDELGEAAEVNVYLASVADVVDEVFPDATLLHLHRDPFEVVRSLVQRGWYDTPFDDRHPDVEVDGWSQLSQPEKAAWYVRATTEAILARVPPERRISLAEITADPAVLADHLAAIDVPFHPHLAAGIGGARQNATERWAIGPVDTWPAEIRAAVEDILTPVRAELGYDGDTPRRRRHPRPLRAVRPRTPAPVVEVLRLGDAIGRLTALGCTWSHDGGRLVVRPAGKGHAHVLLGGGAWRRCTRDDGWAAPSLGAWHRGNLDVGFPSGAMSLFVLAYGDDDALLAQRRLLHLTAPGRYEFGVRVRADAARWNLALYLPVDDQPELVEVSELLVELVPADPFNRFNSSSS